MTVKELKEMLNRHESHHDDEEVTILLALPSIGPRACCKIKYAGFGFDWDKGLQFEPEVRLVPKTDKQDIWETAYSFLAEIATEKTKSYKQRKARAILERYGTKEDEFELFRRVYHKEQSK